MCSRILECSGADRATAVAGRPPNGEYTDKACWYAERGIAEYWIVDEAPGHLDDDAIVHLHHLTLSGDTPGYERLRTTRLSDLEAEYRAR